MRVVVNENGLEKMQNSITYSMMIIQQLRMKFFNLCIYS